MSFSPRFIKTITDISIPANVGSQVVSCVAAHSLLLPLGCAVLSNTPANSSYAYIVSGILVQGVCNVSNAANIWRGILVEFLSQFVKSQGSGEIQLSSVGHGSVVIPSVNWSKTILACTGFSTVNDDPIYWNTADAILTKTSDTVISADVDNTSFVVTGGKVGYSYVEFK